jgi:GNAT superfamily N-acetyltransferase
MNVLEKTRQKYRQGLLTDTIVRKLDKFLFRKLSEKGLKIIPFYLYEEGIFGADWKIYRDGFNEYAIGFLGFQDMKEISSFPRADWASERDLLSRLNDNHKCYGAKYNGRIVAFTWCNFVSCHSLIYKFQLEENEAYLWDAYTSEDFRGKGIAPYLRFKFYEELETLGRNKFYSMSILPNRPAIRFKEKLNARPLILGIYFGKLKKRFFTIRIKTYSCPAYLKNRLKVIDLFKKLFI